VEGINLHKWRLRAVDLSHEIKEVILKGIIRYTAIYQLLRTGTYK